MKKVTKLTLGLLLVIILAACAKLPINLPQTVSETPTAIAVVIPTTTPAENTEPTETEPQILRVWLPPQFDPAAETVAGELLRDRLDTFQKRRPDLILEVRIKAADGPAGLLNALITTQRAASEIMPDLVALPRPELESAALQGILHPIDGLSILLDDPDWFPYARPLALIQNSMYGLPLLSRSFWDGLPPQYRN